MKQPALVIIKPDGISKGLIGSIITKFEKTELEIIAMHVAKATRELAEEHYKHIRGTPFFNGVISYLLGEFHEQKKLLAIIFYGDKAIKKCREVAGATNPEEANPRSIRGSFGRITTRGIYENVVHVSSDPDEAEREIKLWFSPDDVTLNLFPTKFKMIDGIKKRVWA